LWSPLRQESEVPYNNATSHGVARSLLSLEEVE